MKIKRLQGSEWHNLKNKLKPIDYEENKKRAY